MTEEEYWEQQEWFDRCEAADADEWVTACWMMTTKKNNDSGNRDR